MEDEIPAALERAELITDNTLEAGGEAAAELSSLETDDTDDVVTEVLVLEAAMLETDDVNDEDEAEELEGDEDETEDLEGDEDEALDVEELEEDVDEEVTWQVTVIESPPQETDSVGGIPPVSRAAFPPDTDTDPDVLAVATHFNTTVINTTDVFVFSA